MITYLESSVFDSPAQTLVNTVNTEGVMGKGIAKEFKRRFPKMFHEYKALCDGNKISIGNLHIWRDETRWILNFPTKTTWRKPSELSYIEAGLEKFLKSYGDLGITSASFPPLGCGNGGLDWRLVKPLMENYLSKVSIPVYIHNVHVNTDFVPEHHDSLKIPRDFIDFLHDTNKVIIANNGNFSTKTSDFNISISQNDSFSVELKSGRYEKIDVELIEMAWLRLRDRLLFIDSFPDDRSRKLKSYIFPVIAKLPYVKSVDVRKDDGDFGKAIGFYIDRDIRSNYQDAGAEKGDQHCLSL